MTLKIDLPEGALENLQKKAAAQGLDMNTYAVQRLLSETQISASAFSDSLGDRLRAVLGTDYPGTGGTSRLSEVEAACDPG